ncbi:MAG: ParB/RepB/Spo0J family partition protein [Betaproteobacteria bacterium]|nr:ParB/RepB/Spo0J family partition protein [Betaproteobacteria bacterium]
MKGLGRGLDALLAGNDPPAKPVDQPATLGLDQLQSGKYQPRTRMDEAALAELAESIKSQGVMQSILVRPVSATRYEIIAGERRWRAARLAGLTEVPVVVRDVPDSSALAMALIENIQREGLNPLEEAAGVQRLIAEFGLTHEKAAQALGRSRTATTNLLRLLSLSKPVQAMLESGRLEMGHARALLAVQGPRQAMLAERVAARGLNVRQTEKLVQELLNPATRSARKLPQSSRDVQRFVEELSQRFGTTVEIRLGKKGSGKLILSYSSAEHLEDLLSRFK